MATLLRQLQDMIALCLTERISLAALRGWLEDRVEELAESSDPSFAPLAGEVWLLFSEADLGHRTEAEVRRHLYRLIRHRAMRMTYRERLHEAAVGTRATGTSVGRDYHASVSLAVA